MTDPKALLALARTLAREAGGAPRSSGDVLDDLATTLESLAAAQRAADDRIADVLGVLQGLAALDFKLRVEVRGDGGPLDALAAGANMLSEEIEAAQETIEARTSELRERTRVLAAVLDAMAEGVVVADAQGRFVVFNPAAEQLIGLGPTDDPIEAWATTYGVFHPDRVTRVAADELPLVRAIRGESVESSSFYIQSPRRPQGLDIEANARPLLGDDGQPAGGVLVLRDVTESRRASKAIQRLAAIVASSDDAIVSFDPEGLVTTWNHGAERLFGWAEADVLGTDVALDLAMVGEARRGVFLSNQDVEARHEDGSLVPVSVSTAPIRGVDGTLRGISLIARDFRAQKRLELELKAAKEAAEASSRAKSDFLANMSHEIRTPLTAVLGFADLLLDARVTESERLNYVMTIRRNGEHLLSVLNDILDLSRMEAGRLSLERLRCSPAQILNEVASLMRVRTLDKKLSFDLRYRSSMPEAILTDPTRLRQILLNLVGNAVKFTEKGGVSMEARYDPEAQRLFVDIIDTGIGLTEAQIARIFLPFTQADASMTRRFGGTGLGLGISLALARALGGDLSVTSVPGTGSTFSLVIAAEATGSSRRISEAVAGEVGSAEPAAPLEGRLLLAEDGLDNQRLITKILRKRGLEVDVAENGRIAVDRALAALGGGKPYDLILMDMQMPVLDGYGAVAALRGQGYSGRILALTAHAMAGERERCLHAGCDDYLTKPIDAATLIAAVAPAVRRARLETASSAQEDAPLVSTLVDDPDMAELIEEFLAGLPDQLSALQNAASHDELRRLAHQLRGAAGGYGFQVLTDAAGVLEDAVASGADVTGPLAALAGLVARVLPPTRSEQLGTSPGAGLQSVLVIDDSVQIHKLVEARLRPENVALYGALDAEAGLATARTKKPDLILLDFDLGAASGLEVCRQLKGEAETAQIPIVFLTGTADPASKAAALDLGAVDYVTKPFDAVELRARVRAALRTKRYHDLLAQRAQIDGLTGLWNRAFFDARLDEEIAAAIRHHRALAVAMVDIDHFKKVNDTFGHPFGDTVLRAVAEALRACARSSDVVCRYGGEEIAVVFRDTGPASSRRAGERLRERIASMALVHRGQPVRVTASVGVAAVAPGDAERVGREALLGAADAALYESKRGGRDRVSVSHPAPA